MGRLSPGNSAQGNDGDGWANYADGTYTEGSPLALLANTETIVENDASGGLTNESYLPADLDSMYDEVNDKILGVEGDGYSITIEMKAKPTQAGTTRIDFWFDIGGGIPPLYSRTLTFPKGQGAEANLTFTTNVYSLNTWESNGALLKAQANGTVDLYDIRFVVHRSHKA